MKGARVVAFVFAILVGGVTPAFAEERTVTLRVEMWCASCPYIIRRALEDVSGVLDVDVSYSDQSAVVRYDDATTTVTALTQATAGVGFPSEPLAVD